MDDPYFGPAFRLASSSLQGGGAGLSPSDEEVDLEAYESAKADLEARAMEEGELLVTALAIERVGHHRRLYEEGRARVLRERKRRRLSGADWEQRTDG